MAIVLKIGGVDKSDLINFDSLEVRDNLYSKANECYFTYEKYGSRAYVPAGGDEIGVWDGATKIFGGEITNVRVKIEGKVLVYNSECKDWVDQLDGLLVSETYESQTVNAIITDLKSKYATTFDITNVSCATNIEAIYFDMKPMSKCLDELAEITGYHWYVDPDKKIYFFSEGSITSPFDITDDNGHCISDSLEVEEDYEQIKNRVNITGGSIANVQVSDATSIAAYGEHEVVIRDDTLTSTAEATQKANAILAAYKDPIKKGGFQTYDAGLISGQRINVNSTLRGVNQNFIIDSVGFKARTPTDFVYGIEIMTQQDQGLIELFQQEIMKPSAVTSFGNKDFTCDIKFAIVNYHKIEWDAGTIIMSSGETYNIAAGNQEFTNTEICYFNPSVSTTVLQFSTTFGDGVGDDRTALGYAIPNPNVALGAQFIPKGFMGGVRFWGGENIVARTIIADQIGLAALTSDLVTAGEFITSSAQIKNAIITDAKITGTITVGKTDAKCTDPNADQTSANSQNVAWLTDAGDMAYEDLVEASKLGTTIISGGYIKTTLLTATNIVTGTLTGRTVQTAASGARIVLDSTNFFQCFDASHLRVKLDTTSLKFYNYAGNVSGSIIGAAATNDWLWIYATTVLYIQAPTVINDTLTCGSISAQATKPNTNNSYDLGSSSYKWKDIYLSGDIITTTNEDNVTGDLIPTINNNYELGNASYKWYKITAHYTTFGDIAFANNFRITEEEGEREGLAIYNQHDKKIMVLNEDGDLWLAGKLNQETDMKTRLPFYKKILTKQELKKVVKEK